MKYEEPTYGERFRPLPGSGKTMTLDNFKHKLKQLNSKLYVKTDERTHNGGDFYLSGIYFKKRERKNIRSMGDSINYAETEQIKYLQALEAGDLDTFICGICLNHVPEYDVFDLARETMLMPGWRKIVLRIVKLRLCDIDKARKVFSSSLGLQTYDHMKYLKRLAWAKELRDA